MKFTKKTRVRFNGDLGYIVGSDWSGYYVFMADEESDKYHKASNEQYYKYFNEKPSCIGVERRFWFVNEDDVEVVREYKILDKVIPVSKSLYSRSEDALCHYGEMVKRGEVEYLYVIDIYPEIDGFNNVLVLHYNKNSESGNFYLEEDVIPYDEKNVEEWTPKFGELVLSSDHNSGPEDDRERVYLGFDGKTH